MQTVHELLCRAKELEALALTASNPLAKAQWSTMAQDYRQQAKQAIIDQQYKSVYPPCFEH